MAFLSLKSSLSLFRLLKSGFSSSIKWNFLHDLNFYTIFLYLSLICCIVCLFVGFCVSNSDSSVASIRQRSHIKSLFVIMLHQIWKLRYSRHIRIISCIDLESFLLIINLNIVSSSNVFSSLIYVFRSKGITVLNQ